MAKPAMLAALSHARRWARIVSTQLLVIVITLAGFEIGLQILAASSMGALLEPASPWISDKVLGRRGNPHYQDHDARGYRNAVALQQADIVTIGDSHTYGVGVRRHEAWPVALSARVNGNVYSMAHGGYGPGQYEGMLSEALALNPRLIVVTLYMGNDLYDAYGFARGTPIPPELKELAARAEVLEKASPIDKQAAELWFPDKPSSVREWLGRHVKLYRLGHQVRQRFDASPNTRDGLKPDQRRHVSVVDGSGWRTLLRPSYRHLALNQSDPRILLGFELSVRALVSIAERCREQHVALVVVILPTKESVVWSRIADTGSHAQLRELVQDEAAFRGRLIGRLRDADVAVLDLLWDLRAATAQPYPETVDGHPNTAGHHIIAERIAGWIHDHQR